jgi:diguanylate cyclase (GGDEF)-like protein
LVGGFLPPFVVALATAPSAVEWSFCLQITGATIIASLGIFLLMRRTAMRAHLLSVELAHRAAYDGLTGALNRTTWTERAGARLAVEQRQGNPTACLFVDINDFKQINDVHGHEVGDACLGRVADVLRMVAADDRLVGRFGGDEFVVLLPGTGDDEARALSERIHMALRGRAVGVAAASVSIGVAADAGGESLAGLVRRADLEMLDVKARRKQPGEHRLGVPSVSPAVIASVG